MNFLTVRVLASFAAICLLAACTAMSPAPDQPALNGSAWVLSSLSGQAPLAESTPVVSVLNGTSLTMAFAGDGKVGGSAGCNRYTATYTSDAEKLTFGPAAATRKMCAKPEGVMEQEQQFLKALETVATARFEGDRLELRTAGGQLAMTLTKSSGG